MADPHPSAARIVSIDRSGNAFESQNVDYNEWEESRITTREFKIDLLESVALLCTYTLSLLQSLYAANSDEAHKTDDITISTALADTIPPSPTGRFD